LTAEPAEASQDGAEHSLDEWTVEFTQYLVAPWAECVERGQGSVDLLAIRGRRAERHDEAHDAGEDGDHATD
jgi:hypothetical protein